MDNDFQHGHGGDPLGHALGAAARKLAKVYTEALATFPVTPSQYYVLRQLWTDDGLPQREIGLRAQLDATSTTWIVDQIEKVGLVARQRDESDRRLVRVWLTEAGAALREPIETRIAACDNTTESDLSGNHSPAELAIFRHVLRSIVESDSTSVGTDFWAQRAAAWDVRLDALKTSIESTTKMGGAESND